MVMATKEEKKLPGMREVRVRAKTPGGDYGDPGIVTVAGLEGATLAPNQRHRLRPLAPLRATSLDSFFSESILSVMVASAADEK